MKWVAYSVEPTENYHLNLQLSSALQRFIVSAQCLTVWPSTLLFWFTFTAFMVWFFGCRRQLKLEKKTPKPTEHYLFSTKQADKHSQ